MTSTQLSPVVKPKAANCRQAELECRLACLADAGPAAVDDRLAHLDREWNVGRVTKVALAFVILFGTGLTLLFGWGWVLLPLAGGLCLLQYLFSRHSWLGRIVQEMGYRTSSEIEQEKLALKALRGDFRHLPTLHDLEDKDAITRLEGEGGIAVEPDDAKLDSREAAKELVAATQQ
jgi:hypothetical protein